VRRAEIRAALDRARAPGAPRLEVLGVRPAAPVVGLVPGSFDPMTVAHAALALALPAGEVLFVYSPATLPKQMGPGGEPEPPLLAEEDRVASVLAYCEDRPELGVALCSHGLLADQAEAAGGAFPGAGLLFGVGSDKIAQLLDWRWYADRDASLDSLFSRAEVAFAVRAGDEGRVDRILAASRWKGKIRSLAVDRSVAVVSSRAVRAAVRRGEDVRGSVPPEVLPFLSRGEGSP
jgi:nicotinic acid mononucleotide adenylyltransferase